MKTSITFSLVFLLFFCLIGSNLAQVTITQSTFPRPAGFMDSLVVPVQTSDVLPTEGIGQVWDYSYWVSDYNLVYTQIDATLDPVFTEALNEESNDLIFAGMLITSDRYEAVDSNGWYIYGRHIDSVTYPLGSISGGANDSLYFLDHNDIYSGRVDNIPFPLTYQTQRSQSRQETIPFKVTIGAFGLNKTPGFRRRIVDRELEVVGSGTLMMPTSGGSPSAPFDVLLVKINRTLTDPASIACQMIAGGSKALSVLTQPHLFNGSPEYLMNVRQAVDVPILMKDIMIDKVQIDAAKKIGADYMLLIQSLFDQKFLSDIDEFIDYGHKQGLEILLEVHTKQEFQNALKTNADLIGINNRNLDTLKIDLKTTEKILLGFEKTRLILSESGIDTPEDIRYLKKCGADAFLIGSSIMKSDNIEEQVKKLVNAY